MGESLRGAWPRGTDCERAGYISITVYLRDRWVKDFGACRLVLMASYARTHLFTTLDGYWRIRCPLPPAKQRKQSLPLPAQSAST